MFVSTKKGDLVSSAGTLLDIFVSNIYFSDPAHFIEIFFNQSAIRYRTIDTVHQPFGDRYKESNHCAHPYTLYPHHSYMHKSYVT